MKKLIILQTLVLFTIVCFGQGKLTNKPSDTVLDDTDLLWSVHEGTTDKKMAGTVIMGVIHDTANVVRGELGDSIAQVRSEILGEGAWSKTGNYVYPTNYNNDSISVGGAPPLATFHVRHGNALFEDAYGDSLFFQKIRLSGDVYGGLFIDDGDIQLDRNRIRWRNTSNIYEAGTEMYLYSPTAGTYSLTNLATAVSFQNGLTKTGNTVKWMGTINENTDITGSGTSRLWFNSLKDFKLDLDSSYIFRFDYDSIVIANAPGSLGLIIMDTKTTPKGLTYFNDYSTYLRLNNRSIPDVGTVKKTPFDSVMIGYNRIINAGDYTLDFTSRYSVGLDAIRFSFGDQSGFESINKGHALFFATDSIYIRHQGAGTTASFDGTYLRIKGDTAATLDSVRAIVSRGGEVYISGTPVNNQLAAWTDANTIEGNTELLWDGTSLIVDRNSFLQFTDGSNDWRMTQSDATKLEFQYNDVKYYELNTSYFCRPSNGGFLLDYAVGSTTNPAYGFYNDDNTGIGWAGADQLSLISGGVETSRFYPDSVRLYQDIKMYNKKLYFKNISLFDYNGSLQTVVGTTNYVMNQEYMISDPTADDGFYLKTTSSSSTVPMYSFYADQNTGIGTAGADKLSLIAGGSEGIRITTDSIVVKDSLYLDYAFNGKRHWLIQTEGGGIDTATLTPADFVIKYSNQIPSFKDYYLDVVDDERLWATNYRNGDFVWHRGLPSDERAFTALAAKSEMQDKWMNELYEQNEARRQDNLKLTNRVAELEEKVNRLMNLLELE